MVIYVYQPGRLRVKGPFYQWPACSQRAQRPQKQLIEFVICAPCNELPAILPWLIEHRLMKSSKGVMYYMTAPRSAVFFGVKKKRVHLFSSYRLNLQALITLTAFSSSSLRLRFIFLSLASLIISLYSFLALPFLSSLFYFCLGLGFCQPFHHLSWPVLPSSMPAKNATHLLSFRHGMLFVPIFTMSGSGVTTARRNSGLITLEPGEVAEHFLFSSWHHIIKFAAFACFVSHTLHPIEFYKRIHKPIASSI
jgi:hypothetical protein